VLDSGKAKVHAGQLVEIDTGVLPAPAAPAGDPDVVIDVIHADDDLIVVAKPAGLVVHPSPGHAAGTLVNGVLARFPEVAGVGAPDRPGIVHRLDIGTSGLLVIARTQLA